MNIFSLNSKYLLRFIFFSTCPLSILEEPHSTHITLSGHSGEKLGEQRVYNPPDQG